MFRNLRHISDALQGILAALIGMSNRLAEVPPAPDDGLRERVEDLELSRAVWEAEIEGLTLKAENHMKSARAAEERTRTMKRSYEDPEGNEEIDDRLEELAEQFRLQGADGAGITQGQLPTVREDVETLTPKQRLTQAKWGM